MKNNETEKPLQILTSALFNNFAIFGLIKFLNPGDNIYVYATAFIITTAITLLAYSNEIKLILKK